MLRFLNYDIVFQEVPKEVSLAINISNCPNRCKGCHSPQLMEDTGEILNEEILTKLLEKYGNSITCVCFMGGDNSPTEIEQLAIFIQKNYSLKIAWYSGKEKFSDICSLQNFNYLKLGQFVENLGGLSSSTTNQRFYKIEENKMIEITAQFYKNN